MTGEFALRFLEHSPVRNIDLDIYVQHGEKTQSLHTYLIHEAGYSLEQCWLKPEIERINFVEVSLLQAICLSNDFECC